MPTQPVIVGHGVGFVPGASGGGSGGGWGAGVGATAVCRDTNPTNDVHSGVNYRVDLTNADYDPAGFRVLWASGAFSGKHVYQAPADGTYAFWVSISMLPTGGEQFALECTPEAVQTVAGSPLATGLAGPFPKIGDKGETSSTPPFTPARLAYSFVIPMKATEAIGFNVFFVSVGAVTEDFDYAIFGMTSLGGGAADNGRVIMASAHAFAVGGYVPFDTTQFDNDPSGIVVANNRFQIPDVPNAWSQARIVGSVQVAPGGSGTTEYELILQRQNGGAGTPDVIAQTTRGVDTTIDNVVSFLIDSGPVDVGALDVISLSFDGDTGGLGGNYVVGTASFRPNYFTIERIA